MSCLRFFCTSSTANAVPLLLQGEGLRPLRVGNAMPDRGRVLPFASAGGAKPIAARERDAGRLVGR